MAVARYKDIRDWINDCRQLVRSGDLDNVVLCTGDPGKGKSTIMYQIGLALDEAFDEERIHFSLRAFLAEAPLTPRYGVVAADEFDGSRRNAMRRELRAMNDWLNRCRGLNLHILLCFPFEGRLDEAILNDRVRYKVDVKRRGKFDLYERAKKEWRNPRGELKATYTWVFLGSWYFGPNAGDRWRRYKAKKEAGMREPIILEERGAAAGAGGPDSLGMNRDAVVALARAVVEAEDDRPGSRADIRSNLP